MEELNSLLQRVETALLTGVSLKREEANMVIEALEKAIKEGQVYSAVLSLMIREAMKRGDIGREDIEKFREIVEEGLERKKRGEPPFGEKEKEILVSIFTRMGANRKAAFLFYSDFDTIKGIALKNMLNEVLKTEAKNKITNEV